MQATVDTPIHPHTRCMAAYPIPAPLRLPDNAPRRSLAKLYTPSVAMEPPFVVELSNVWGIVLETSSYFSEWKVLILPEQRHMRAGQMCSIERLSSEPHRMMELLNVLAQAPGHPCKLFPFKILSPFNFGRTHHLTARTHAGDLGMSPLEWVRLAMQMPRFPYEKPPYASSDTPGLHQWSTLQSVLLLSKMQIRREKWQARLSDIRKETALGMAEAMAAFVPEELPPVEEVLKADHADVRKRVSMGLSKKGWTTERLRGSSDPITTSMMRTWYRAVAVCQGVERVYIPTLVHVYTTSSREGVAMAYCEVKGDRGDADVHKVWVGMSCWMGLHALLTSGRFRGKDAAASGDAPDVERVDVVGRARAYNEMLSKAGGDEFLDLSHLKVPEFGAER